MINSKILSTLSSNPDIKRLGLSESSLVAILDSYNDILIDNLLENGRIEVGNGLIIEVVKLLDRVHVLRGTTYKSNRKYKLKLTMEDRVYDKIESYYNKLQEDIM